MKANWYKKQGGVSKVTTSSGAFLATLTTMANGRDGDKKKMKHFYGRHFWGKHERNNGMTIL